MFADWLEDVDPAVADQMEEPELESDAVVVDSGFEPEAVAADELVPVEAAPVSPAAFAAQLAPRPTNVEMLRAAANTRERAAACRRFLFRARPSTIRAGRSGGAGVEGRSGDEGVSMAVSSLRLGRTMAAGPQTSLGGIWDSTERSKDDEVEVLAVAVSAHGARFGRCKKPWTPSPG